MNRRTFFRRTAGAVVTAAVAPHLPIPVRTATEIDLAMKASAVPMRRGGGKTLTALSALDAALRDVYAPGIRRQMAQLDRESPLRTLFRDSSITDL